MDSMSYKIAIVYTSKTGNTKELVDILGDLLLLFDVDFIKVKIHEFSLDHMSQFDAIVIATYTWGNGEIPPEIVPLYHAFEDQDVRNLVTGVVGTGDQFYPHFCGAVDEFRDMLFVQTRLAATLKVELLLQDKDRVRCRKFVDALMSKSRI